MRAGIFLPDAQCPVTALPFFSLRIRNINSSIRTGHYNALCKSS
jgi:hypothetical protein